MRTVTPAWFTTLGASHSIKNTISIWENGVRKADLPFTDANVVLDMDAESYGSLTVSVADADMLAEDTTALLLPYGQRLFVECGIYTTAGLETISINCDFLITETPTSSGWMTDREVVCSTPIEMVKDARFLVPYQPAKGTAAKTILSYLLDDAVPGTTTITYETTANPVLGVDQLFERERWEAVQDMTGRLDSWIQPVPGGFKVRKLVGDNFAGPAVWAVKHGQNLLSGTQPSVTRERYNAVVAFNSEDEKVWAVAYDTNPASPTRWSGPYGKRPAFMASTWFETDVIAQAAADNRLISINGRSRIADVMTVCNPAIEPGDIVDVLWPGATVLEKTLVRRVEIPLIPGPMKLTIQGAPV